MTEKKYIIDGAFLARLYQLIEMECPNDDLRDELAALKPVEPLTTGSIAKILSLLPIPPSTGAELHDWAESLARAIESHILEN